MGLIRIMERGGDDARQFDEHMMDAKYHLMEACKIWEDMKAQFSERGGDYGERGDYRMRGSYRRDGYDEMSERRGRDSRGRYM